MEYLHVPLAAYLVHPARRDLLVLRVLAVLPVRPALELRAHLAPVVLLVPVAFVDSAPRRLENAIFILAIIDELLILFLVLDWYSVSCLLMGAVTHCPSGRRWAFFLTLPLMWLACLLLSCLIPAAVFLISLMILSFR